MYDIGDDIRPSMKVSTLAPRYITHEFLSAMMKNINLALPPLGGHLTRENVHMGKTRREFTPEHKDEAVQLMINTGETGVTESERAELLRLRKENADLKLDRAFLKEASIFFAQEPSDTGAKRSN
ncbi:hypothetical protein [Cryobacterium sp. Y11]|uniref:hypothetical protein n=1 Tax=Cryobacterium sp. Y11 TaxID=2045016 RepID=UPI000CE3E9C3|nr:hypothetical protein [Cryobacterium sp. Y11]